MPANYVLLEKIVVGAAGAAPITFNNIPQSGYTDLIVKISSRQNLAQIYGVINIRFNGTGGTAYTYKVLEGNGSSVSSAGQTSIDSIYGVYSDSGANTTASTFSSMDIYIPNYTSNTFKSVSIDSVFENNATSANAIINTGVWANTAAITSITLVPDVGTLFAQNSTATLYGIKNS
jgi:hypothetical protein